MLGSRSLGNIFDNNINRYKCECIYRCFLLISLFIIFYFLEKFLYNLILFQGSEQRFFYYISFSFYVCMPLNSNEETL